MVNNDSSHCFCRRSEEVRSTLPLLQIGALKSQPGLVNQCSWLERLTGRQSGHPTRGEPAQVLVHLRHQIFST
jgi:hypothetical protein